MPLRAMRSKARMSARMPDNHHQKLKHSRPGVRRAHAACGATRTRAENPCIAAGLGLKLGRGWGAARRRGVCLHRQELRSHPLNLAGHAR